MDTTDSGIVFDKEGVCNRCKEYLELVPRYIDSEETREQELLNLINTIKNKGRKNKYDCIIGVSGGVDSTFVAKKVKEFGLRPLAVHLDNGWNTELAVSNIEKTMKNLGIDLYTHVLNWEQFKDLQLSFLKASTPDSEFPSDHAIYALMIRMAAKYNIKYIISGVNLVTEGITGPKMSASAFDYKYISSIHKIFGTKKLTNNFPRLTLYDFFYYRYIRRIKLVYLLNKLNYSKSKAIEDLKSSLGWEPYTGKHHESIYTRFFQSYILPKKFNFDKRIMHYSALIMSGQITRENALKEMKNEICDKSLVQQDKSYVAKKLGIQESELDQILSKPPSSGNEYPSSEKNILLRFYRFLKNKYYS
tara:strand:+ start:2891 stop:3973 length:1083 start_codon:yes stop_codon:yes gene_type:complete